MALLAAARSKPAAGLCALEPVQQPLAVTLRLQPPDQPRARVGEALVVEVDRVLRGEHDAEAGRARLLHQRQQRALGRRLGDRRREAVDLVEVQDGAQARRARLAPHPADDGLQEQRDDEHPLRVAEVRDGDDRDARPPALAVQQRLHVDRVAAQPEVEARRGEQVVDGHRQAEAVLGREERLQVEDADARRPRVLDARDERRQVEALALRPGVLQDRREQDVLAALHRVAGDADQRQQPRRRGRDRVAQALGVVAIGRRCQGAEHGQGAAGVAAGRVDREVGSGAQAADALAVLAPPGQALLPARGLLRREGVDVDAGTCGGARVDPGREVGGRQVGEGQQEVAEIALGVDQDRRHAVDRRLLQEVDAQAGLAAARHADADGVRDEVRGVVEHELLARLAVRPDRPAEIQDAELLEVDHGGTMARPVSPSQPPHHRVRITRGHGGVRDATIPT